MKSNDNINEEGKVMKCESNIINIIQWKLVMTVIKESNNNVRNNVNTIWK